MFIKGKARKEEKKRNIKKREEKQRKKGTKWARNKKCKVEMWQKKEK